MKITIYLPDERATIEVATHVARVLSAPLLLGFSGEIGAGKTTFIRAMLRALGVQGAIKSPTYALVESYLIEGLPIHHFDLYRIQEEAELDYIGFRDYFMAPSICCIEWSEHMGMGRNRIDIQLTLTMKGMGRELVMLANNPLGEKMLSLLPGLGTLNE